MMSHYVAASTNIDRIVVNENYVAASTNIDRTVVNENYPQQRQYDGICKTLTRWVLQYLLLVRNVSQISSQHNQ